MATVVHLPHVGESVTEGIIGKWLKRVGDTVQKYDPLVEVVTDKVTMEVPSPYEGRLTAILASEGATVPMGSPIAEMETTETVAEVAPVPSASGPPAATPQPIGRTGVLLKDERPVGPTGAGEEAAAQPAAPAVERPRYSPVVRKLAEEHGIDLSQVRGTGIGGRVNREDVLRYLEERRAAPARPAPRLAEAPGASAEEEALALTPVRRLIAENMARSAREVPQAWTSVEVDVTSLVRYRESVREEFQRREGFELTYLPFFIKAIAEGLKRHPLLNATWGGDKIVLKKRINIGIAVATPQGLIVPVIHDADRLGIGALARAARELIDRARAGKLTLENVQGGTFTLNNTGALGALISQPLLNPPQAAMLATEAIIKRPVVVAGDAIAVRSMMVLSLTFDHRVLDGAEGAAFLQEVKRLLEAMGPDTPLS
ncbi:MAG: 2-oxo acid dehydrogenase subunit E2 [Chloroflexi bacterium]|nr:2-oxo acid dehydrogenase subunit E2 [Chloroflexota bacterium]